jgi:hypothetical protein
VVETVRREGRDLGDERVVGVEQKNYVASGRRGKDCGGGEKEGRVGDFRELDKNANKHDVGRPIDWVKREKVNSWQC